MSNELYLKTGYVYINNKKERVLINNKVCSDGDGGAISFEDTGGINYRQNGEAIDFQEELSLVEELFEVHGRDDQYCINFYESDYYCFSSFSSFSLLWEGIRFDTLEAAYHYEKFNPIGYPEMNADLRRETALIRGLILRANSAHAAFTIARYHGNLKRPDWDEAKVRTMFCLVIEKIRQHEYVRTKLKKTYSRRLVEDSWRDDYWGTGPNGDGLNVLGQIWMLARTIVENEAVDKIDPMTYSLESIITKKEFVIEDDVIPVPINFFETDDAYVGDVKLEKPQTSDKCSDDKSTTSYKDWTEPSKPNGECRYDHTTLNTPLGMARIEWKSWKGPSDGYGLFLNGEYIDVSYTLDEAKSRLEKHLKEKYDSLGKFIYPSKTIMIKPPLPEWIEDTEQNRSKIQELLKSPVVCEFNDNDITDFIQQLRGRAKFLREQAEVKSPELLEKAADLLSNKIRS